MKYTLHTHTVGFDGRDTIQEMVNRARESGYTTIGISNHFIVHPGIKSSNMYPHAVKHGYNSIYAESFDEVLSRFVPHYEELERIKAANLDMNILRGMEVDFFRDINWLRGFDKSIRILKPDYVIGAAHFIEQGGKLLNSHDWEKADATTKDNLLEKYWTNVADAASSGMFTWMAHLDLPKKKGLGRETKWQDWEHRVISAASKSKTPIEINTGFYRDWCYEPYPSLRILNMAKQENVPVLISDDAHNIDQIGRHFDEASQLIKRLNLKTYIK